MTSVQGECALAVFARAPVPGEAKTRLIPLLGAAVVVAIPKRLGANAVRYAATGFTVPPLLMAIWLYGAFDRTHRPRMHRQQRCTVS